MIRQGGRGLEESPEAAADMWIRTRILLSKTDIQVQGHSLPLRWQEISAPWGMLYEPVRKDTHDVEAD